MIAKSLTDSMRAQIKYSDSLALPDFLNLLEAKFNKCSKALKSWIVEYVYYMFDFPGKWKHRPKKFSASQLDSGSAYIIVKDDYEMQAFENSVIFASPINSKTQFAYSFW